MPALRTFCPRQLERLHLGINTNGLHSSSPFSAQSWPSDTGTSPRAGTAARLHPASTIPGLFSAFHREHSIRVAHLAQSTRESVEVSLATVLVAAAGDVVRDFVPVDFLAFACWGCRLLVSRYL